MVSEGGIQDRLERFITRHPIWVTIGFAGFLFVLSALLLAFFPSLVAILGLSLQSQAVAEPAIGTQTLLVVVVTGAVALTGLLLSIFQIRHRDQEILLSHAQNLNRAANDAARRIFGLAKSLIKLQQSVQLLYQSVKDQLKSSAYSLTPPWSPLVISAWTPPWTTTSSRLSPWTPQWTPPWSPLSTSAWSPAWTPLRTFSPAPPSTGSCGNDNRRVKLPPMVEAACQKLEQALVAVIESVHEIRRDPNSLNLACEIAGGMIERFGLPDWRDRFVANPVTEEVYRPKSAAPFNPVVFFDALEGLEVTLFYLKDRSRILEYLKLPKNNALFYANPANFALFFGLISVKAFALYVTACLSCMVPWDAADPKAASKAESKGESDVAVKREVSKTRGDVHPVDEIWRNAIQSTFVDPVVKALAGDKGEKERVRLSDFLLKFLDVLRMPTDGVLSLRGMVRDFYLTANLVTKRYKDNEENPLDSKLMLELINKLNERYYGRYYGVK